MSDCYDLWGLVYRRLSHESCVLRAIYFSARKTYYSALKQQLCMACLFLSRQTRSRPTFMVVKCVREIALCINGSFLLHPVWTEPLF